MIDKYQISREIGEGSFGKVYFAIDKDTNTPVALKVLAKGSFQFGRRSSELKALQKEADIHQKLNHPNIIRLLSTFDTPSGEFVFVCEFAASDLNKLLAKNGGLGEEWTQRLAHDIISALYYLHLRRILHRDLKPPNILLTSMDKNAQAKICDFGLARNMTLGTKVLISIKGTPLYMAPEVLDAKGPGYGHEADLWSAGCVIYEMIAGEPPFYALSIGQLVQLMKYSDVKWPSFLSTACIDFLKRLLVKDPKARMKWKQILTHKFVEGKIHFASGDENRESAFTSPIDYQQEIEKTQQAAAIQRISRSKKNDAAGEDFRSSRESLRVNLNLQSEVEETDVEDAFAMKTETEKIETDEVKPTMAKIQPLPNMQQFQPRIHNIGNFQPVAENSNMVMHRFMDNVDPELANLMMIPPCSNFPVFPGINSIQKMTQDIENFSFREGKSVEVEAASMKKSQKTHSEGIATDVSSIPVETEEWLQFLFKSMQEILDGDLEIYKQQNMLTMIVGLLRESKFDSKIVDNVVQIISLPYAIDVPQSTLDEIDRLYLRTKVVPNLVFRSKLLCGKKVPQNSTDLTIPKVDKLIQFNKSELKTLSSIYDLVVFLVYSGDNFLEMFCDTVALMNLDNVFRSFILSGMNGDSEDGTRLAASIIALINAILQELPELCCSNQPSTTAFNNLIENIIFHNDIDFCKLLSINDKKLRLRTCLMLRLLGRFCCLSLRNHWRPEIYKCLTELLDNEDEEIRSEAANLVEELKDCVNWFKAENFANRAFEVNF